MNCLRALARFWAVNDEARLPERVSVIVLVSFGATAQGLTRGARATAEKAQALQARFPDARIVFGVFTKSPCDVELRAKQVKFPKGIYAGQVVSTIEEAVKCIRALGSGYIGNVAVVTDQWHSLRALIAWRYELEGIVPRDSVYVVSVSSALTVGPDNPMKPLHKEWKWALINVVLYPFFWFPPTYAWFKKNMATAHQPT